MGSTGGDLWKMEDGGVSWTPGRRIPSGSARRGIEAWGVKREGATGLVSGTLTFHVVSGA